MTNVIQQASRLNSKYLVEVDNKGDIYTDSLKVAAAFGRRHDHVLRAIKNLDCSTEFCSTHFWGDTVVIGLGANRSRNSKIYRMTKDGFMFLVMGFTGKKAAQVKEAYITAFNKMYAELYGDAQPMPRLVEFRGKKVLQLRQIDQLHGKTDYARRAFAKKRADLEEGFDYFSVAPEDKHLLAEQGIKPYRRNMVLVTAYGYRKITRGLKEEAGRSIRKRVLEGYYIQAEEYSYHIEDRDHADAYKALGLLRKWGVIRKTQQGSARAERLGEWGLQVENFLAGNPLPHVDLSDDSVRHQEAEQLLLAIIQNDASRSQNDFEYAQRDSELWVQRVAWAKRWGLLKKLPALPVKAAGSVEAQDSDSFVVMKYLAGLSTEQCKELIQVCLNRLAPQ